MLFCLLSAIAFTSYIYRRYRLQRYSTQTFSRRSDLIEKAQLPPLKIPWNVKYPDYKPLGEISETRFWWLDLTFIDGRMRFLIEVSPFTFCRVPFNPFGRTGVQGKGLLPYFGPNSMIITIFWSPNKGFLKMIYLKRGCLLYRGYLDHPMNTDNAWIEASIYSLEVQDFPESFAEECPDWLESITKKYIKVSK